VTHESVTYIELSTEANELSECTHWPIMLQSVSNLKTITKQLQK